MKRRIRLRSLHHAGQQLAARPAVVERDRQVLQLRVQRARILASTWVAGPEHERAAQPTMTASPRPSTAMATAPHRSRRSPEAIGPSSTTCSTCGTARVITRGGERDIRRRSMRPGDRLHERVEAASARGVDSGGLGRRGRGFFRHDS